MKKFIEILFIVTCILGTVAHAVSTDTAENVNTTISITPLDKGHIKVEYALGKMCKALHLLSPYQERTQSLRKDWRLLDDCGELSTSGVLTQTKSCKAVSISVPIQASMMDRVNPSAYPLAQEGVLIHTGIFSVGNTCGDVVWNFNSPHGDIVVDGKNRGEVFKIDQTKASFIKYTGVYFSYKKMDDGRSIVVTKDVPLWLRQGITNADTQLSTYYSSVYPGLNFKVPALFVDNMKTGSQAYYQADVSSRRMVRFGFFNYQDSDAEKNIANIQSTSAHEYAHILQPKILTETSDPFIFEGGAEFMRWTAEYHLGWQSKEYLAANFSNNLANCLNSLGDLAWRDVPLAKKNSGAFPYACGLSIHVIALASRKNKESSEQTIGNYYLQMEKDPTTDFAQSIECGSDKKCAGSWLPNFLKGKASAREQINDQLYKLGIVKDISYSSDQLKLSLIQSSFQDLMIEDCGGMGFWTNQDHFLIDDIPNCRSFKKDLKISSVDGISYFKEPVKAMHAQYQACANQHAVILDTVDGQRIKVPCLNSKEPSKNYYEIDSEKLWVLLDKR